MLKNTTIICNPGTALGKRNRHRLSTQASKSSLDRGSRSSRRESRKQRDSTVFRRFRVLMTNTLPILFPNSDQNELTTLIDYILHIHKHKGSEYIVRYLKATEESVLAIVFGENRDLGHDKVSLGKDADRWPHWLGSRLKSNCFNQQWNSIRLVLTLCSARRLLTIQTKTDLSSIVSPPTWVERIDMKPILETLGGRDKDLLKVRTPEIGSESCDEAQSIVSYMVPKLQISLKSSPNGISFFSFPWDRAALVQSGVLEKVKAWAETYFKGPVEDWIEERIEPYEELVDSNRQLHVGKIDLTHETGKLKPRVFAMLDSFTQSLLGDFHRDLMNILRKIPEDCTFDQDKVSRVARLKHDTESVAFYGFADLSNASDRIPYYLYEEIGNHIKADLGSAWVAIFDRDFSLSDNVKAHRSKDSGTTDSIRYRCGQPMGALSSWPFMALVHHVLVWSAFGSRKAAIDNYLLLGDDLVIFKKEAYYRYCTIMRTLGVPITHGISTMGFEFAKRVFLNGVEVTGAYSAALTSNLNEPEIFVTEWGKLRLRGYRIGIDLPRTFELLLKTSRKRFKKCNFLLNVPYGTSISQQDLLQWIAGISGRNFCLLGRVTKEELVERIKPFRQIAALMIKANFQKELDKAKSALLTNEREFAKHFQARSGLIDHYPHAMQEAINEVASESRTRIRMLEKALKLQYLNPTDKRLLRPSIPDFPYEINFKNRDRHMVLQRYRAEHLMRLGEELRG